MLKKSSVYEHMIEIEPIRGELKWKRNPNCMFGISDTMKNVLNRHNFKETRDDNYHLYLPCTYNKINDEIYDIQKLNNGKINDQRFFIVNNADQLSSKNNIWANLVKTYGRKGASYIMPTTYLLFDKQDMELFDEEHDPDKIYILKKNIQRQEGLKITNNKDEILEASKDNYVVVQELLQDPYLINGRKINMRFYVLFVCKNNEVSTYVHWDGFMYYTAKLFTEGSLEDGPNITTGYIDRSVYDKNPLTLSDFREYLDDPNRNLSQKEMELIYSNMRISRYVFSEIYKMLKKVAISVSNSICIDSYLRPYLTFQLFGADVALNKDLHPQLMEMNKGPDLGAKDARDSNVKHVVVSDILKVIKMVGGNHRFIKIM